MGVNLEKAAEWRECFRELDREDRFCAQGFLPPVLPGIEVEGVGPVGLPLVSIQAAQIAAVARRAPFGKGEETLVDPEVRNTWEVDASRVRLKNPVWDKLLEEALRTVAEELGVSNGRLVPHLYKLLLYERGGFFVAHKDSEKLPGMVASLLVYLPSAHSGGALEVRQGTRRMVVDSSVEKALYQPMWAAFYADCEHEVKPVESGWRLCLAYNLVLEGGDLEEKGAAAGAAGKMRTLLRDWAASENPGKLVFGLEHCYSPDGIQRNQLKGADRGRVEALMAFASELQLEISIGIFGYHESWTAACEGWEWGRSSSRRRSRFRDNSPKPVSRSAKVQEEDFDESQCVFEVDELIDSSVFLESLRGLGRSWEMKRVTISEEEVVLLGALKGVQPEEEYEGYTGNAGEMVERWYRHAAVVLWPRRNHFDELKQSSPEGVWNTLADWMEQGTIARSEALATAQGLLEELQRGSSWEVYEVAGNAAASLVRLGDERLLCDFVQIVATTSSGRNWVEPLQEAPLPLLKSFLPVCSALFESSENRMAGELFDLLEAGWIRMRDAALLKRTLQACVSGVKGLDVADAFRRLLSGAVLLEHADLLGVAIAGVERANLPLKGGRTGIVSGLLEACSGKKKLQKLAVKFLEKTLAELEPLREKPMPYADLSRPAEFSCGKAGCAPCRKLKGFLEHPGLEQDRFCGPLSERKHVIQTVQEHLLDIDIEVDRSQSPHSLRLSKNAGSHARRVEQWKSDLVLLGSLEALLARNKRE